MKINRLSFLTIAILLLNSIPINVPAQSRAIPNIEINSLSRGIHKISLGDPVTPLEEGESDHLSTPLDRQRITRKFDSASSRWEQIFEMSDKANRSEETKEFNFYADLKIKLPTFNSQASGRKNHKQYFSQFQQRSTIRLVHKVEAGSLSLPDDSLPLTPVAAKRVSTSPADFYSFHGTHVVRKVNLGAIVSVEIDVRRVRENSSMSLEEAAKIAIETSKINGDSSVQFNQQRQKDLEDFEFSFNTSVAGLGPKLNPPDITAEVGGKALDSYFKSLKSFAEAAAKRIDEICEGLKVNPNASHEMIVLSYELLPTQSLNETTITLPKVEALKFFGANAAAANILQELEQTREILGRIQFMRERAFSVSDSQVKAFEQFDLVCASHFSNLIAGAKMLFSTNSNDRESAIKNFENATTARRMPILSKVGKDGALNIDSNLRVGPLSWLEEGVIIRPTVNAIDWPMPDLVIKGQIFTVAHQGFNNAGGEQLEFSWKVLDKESKSKLASVLIHAGEIGANDLQGRNVSKNGRVDGDPKFNSAFEDHARMFHSDPKEITVLGKEWKARSGLSFQANIVIGGTGTAIDQAWNWSVGSNKILSELAALAERGDRDLLLVSSANRFSPGEGEMFMRVGMLVVPKW